MSFTTVYARNKTSHLMLITCSSTASVRARTERFGTSLGMPTPLLGSTAPSHREGFSISELVFSVIAFAGLVAFAVVAMVSIFSTPNRAFAEAQWVTRDLNTKPAPANQMAATISLNSYIDPTGNPAARNHMDVSETLTTPATYRYSVDLINPSSSACITYRVATSHWTATSGACK
jgi:hypothetical protein